MLSSISNTGCLKSHAYVWWEMTDEYSVQSRRGLCVKTGQLRVELIALKVV
jgi:hypothetical protein